MGTGLTVADDPGVLPVVAVVDAPAGEGAEVDASLVAGALHVVHPDGARDVPVGSVAAQHRSKGAIKPQHPGGEGGGERRRGERER